MPTLFTALKSHADQVRQIKAKPRRVAQPELPAERYPGIGGALAEVVTVTSRTRKKKQKEPHPRLSLKDRFKIVGKPTPPLHVIVIGAGFAGLAAAYELQSVGYNVTVLEAERDVGGRVLTRHDVVPGEVMEGGAELIGLNHLAWWSYKDKFGLRFRQLSEPVNPPVILRGKRLTPDKADSLFHEMHRAQRLISQIAKRVDPDQPWKTRGAKSLDRRSLVSGLRSLPMSADCRLAFLEQLQADNGVEARRQSWLGNLAMIKGGGLSKFWTETETHHCKGGNQQLAFKFKAQLKDLKTRRAVKESRLNPNGVTVFPRRGNPVTGTDVVLAVPPTMLGDIVFKPKLPTAYKKLQFGKNVKYLLNVRNGSWKPEDPDMSSDGPIDLTWEGTDDRNGSRAGLVAFSGAIDADTCAKWGNRKRAYLNELAPVYPGLRSASRNGVFMNWPKRKWTRGSYSFPKPGEVTRVGPLLRSGFKGKVHFAGEHTCYAFTGYMEAALRSGLRVAEQLARRDGVIR